MMRYFCLRLKLLSRLLPWVLAAALLLGVSGIIVGSAMLTRDAQGAEHQKYTVALCGSLDDPLLQLGITALKKLDETRFSVELLTMEEPAARQAVMTGELSGYVVIPPGFLQSALSGNVPTLRFVTNSGGTAVEAFFRDEITSVISRILRTAQEGSYGAYFAYADNQMEQQALTALNELCIEYVDLALSRGKTYHVQLLGVGSGLDLKSNLICGLSVVLISLLCLPFAPMLVQKECSLSRLLAARGCVPGVQAVVDFSCMVLGLWAVLCVLILGLNWLGLSMPFDWHAVLPVALLAAAVGFFLNSLARELVSGVLAQFFATIVMCFLSGCVYPLYFLPITVQRLGTCLPTGLCRAYLASCMTGAGDRDLLGGLLLLSMGLVVAACWIRHGRILHAKGAV